MDSETYARIGYLALLLAAVGGWVIVEFRGRMGQALRTAAAWGLIFLGLAAGYGLWGDIRSRVTPGQILTEGGRIELPRAEDGHYYATLTVNGTSIRFVVDTGATNLVLSRSDAQRLGIDPETLVYLGRATTANGTVATARVSLDRIAFGPYEDRDFPAWVNDGQMDGSLLGMDYLGRFRIEIAGNRMILTR